MSLDALLTQAEKASGRASLLVVRSNPSLPVAVTFGKDETLLFDPYTAESLGTGATTLRGLFKNLLAWHRWLGASEAKRAAGKAITGAANLVFLFLLLSGLVLWCPRAWNWLTLKQAVLLNPSASGKARDWNWHNVFGIWSALPLFIIIVSGIIMSYPWANKLLFQLAGSEPPAIRAETEVPKKKEPKASKSAGRSLDKAFAQVEEKFAGWKTLRIRLPQGDGLVTFLIDQGNGRPDKKSQATFDSKSGELIKSETFANYNLGRKLRTFARFLHTGQAGGIAGQGIAVAASAGGAVLVWTGVSMALRRFRARRLRAKTEI
jgi:uncharacterized iron-regulated membrane protein